MVSEGQIYYVCNISHTSVGRGKLKGFSCKFSFLEKIIKTSIMLLRI